MAYTAQTGLHLYQTDLLRFFAFLFQCGLCVSVPKGQDNVGSTGGCVGKPGLRTISPSEKCGGTQGVEPVELSVAPKLHYQIIAQWEKLKLQVKLIYLLFLYFFIYLLVLFSYIYFW